MPHSGAAAVDGTQIVPDAAAGDLVDDQRLCTVFCYTKKAGLRQMHCMLRVAVKAPR